MYCSAILPRERQFGEVSYFKVLSRTSITQRLTASLNWVAIASSRESPDEHADIGIDAEGMVEPGTSGMSVAPAWRLLPTHRIPRRLRKPRASR